LCSELLRELDDPRLLGREEEDVNNYPYLHVNEDKRRKIEESSSATFSPDLCNASRFGALKTQIEGCDVHVRLLDKKGFLHKESALIFQAQVREVSPSFVMNSVLVLTAP